MDSLAWVRLIASPMSGATESCVSLNGSFAGSKPSRSGMESVTTSSSSCTSSIRRSTPFAVSGKCETKAWTDFAPFSRHIFAAAESVPPVAVMSSIIMTSWPFTSPTTENASTVSPPVRCFATMASPHFSLRL